MEDSRKIHYFFLVLVFLFGCYGAYVNYKVLQEDTTPFIYDILNSYVTSIDHYRFLQQGDIIGFINHYITKYSRDYPALYMFQTFPFYAIFGISEDAAAMSNTIYLFILLFSVYFIGKKMKNSYAGFLSASIVLFIPGVLSFSRVYLPDFGLAAFFLLSLALFLYSDFFRDRKYSILFGASAGLGMLIKYTFFVYIGVALFILYLRHLKNEKKLLLTKQQRSNLMISLSIAVLFMLLWYPMNFLNALGYITRKSSYDATVAFNDTGIFQRWNLVMDRYVFEMNDMLAGFVYPVFLIIVLLLLEKVFSRRKTQEKKTIELQDLVYISLIIFLFSLNSTASVRYLIFMLPFAALLIGVYIYTKFDIFLGYFKNRNETKFMVFVLLVLLLVSSAGSYYSAWLEQKKPAEIADDIFIYGLQVPKHHHNKHIEIIEAINRRMEGLNGLSVLSFQESEVMYIVSHSKHLSGYGYEFPPACLTTPDYVDRGSCYIPEEINCDWYFLQNDIIIDSDIHTSIKTAEVWAKFPERKEILDEILNVWESCKENYILAETIEDVPVLTSYIPREYTNSTLYLYVKKSKLSS
ncbi:TPA: phospholipid carrier-dependent glycosyltransferase [Candidatus Woesearchaeota archaeon]|nr:hypothetical protein QT06_C0001G1003 [archaeon GW2011_AR15]MBS3104523.1 glycosyltransferase family 39 protein [Candidatus Woesearchaeota archaeon]HIH41163.1 phospholipid carrier-dependent glycosyltransferase [Candidatus Woesearchaeota archaeon]